MFMKAFEVLTESIVVEELELEGTLARMYYGIVPESTPALATAGQR